MPPKTNSLAGCFAGGLSEDVLRPAAQQHVSQQVFIFEVFARPGPDFSTPMRFLLTTVCLGTKMAAP